MNDMLLLIIILVFCLIVLLKTNYSDTEKNSRLQRIADEAEAELISEMRREIVLFYGNQIVAQKNLTTYEDYEKELSTIHQKYKNLF